jgi:hypothetical protein
MLSIQDINMYCCALLDSIKHYNPCFYPLFSAMYRTGCRFEDISRSFNSSYDTVSFCYLPAKNNNLRSVLFSDIEPLYQSFVKGVDCFYFRYSYSSAFRAFNKALFPTTIFVGKKACNLHLFRHNKAKLLHAAGLSISEIQEYFGHQNKYQSMRYIFSELSY